MSSFEIHTMHERNSTAGTSKPGRFQQHLTRIITFRPFCLLLFSLLCCSSAMRAQGNADSVRRVLQAATTDSVRISCLLELCKEATQENSDSAMLLLEDTRRLIVSNYYRLRKMAAAQGNKAVLKKERTFYVVAAAKFYQLLADVYSRNSNLMLSAEYYQRGIQLWEMLEAADPANRNAYLKNKSATYTNIGNVYRRQQRIPQALDSYFKGLRIDEELKNKKGIAVKLGNIGIAYEELNDDNRALDYYNRSLAIKKELGNKKSIAMTLANIGVIYKRKEDYSRALAYYNEALQLARENKMRSTEATILGNIGNVYILQRRFPEALEAETEALEIDRALGNIAGVRLHTGNIGNLYLDWKKYGPAEKYLLEAMSLAEKAGDLDNIYSFSLPLSEMYEELAKSRNSPAYYEKALRYYKVYADAADRISNEEKAKEQVRVEMNYEFGKKEAENKFRMERQAGEMQRIKREKEISDLELKQEQASRRFFIIILVSALLVLGILSVLLVSLVRTMRERKKAFTRLEEKNVEIREQGKQLVMQSKQLTRYQAQMNPHFIFNALNSIQGFVVNNEKEKTLTQLQAFSKLMRQTLSNSDRETILLEKELEYLALYIAFEQERFSQHIHFVKHIAVDETDIEIPPMLIQPFIENALKHAGFHETAAPQITLDIRGENGLLRVQVSDNGKGISGGMENVEKQSHAISIIRSRIRLLFENEQLPLPDVLLELRSVPVIETGTTVIFYLPLITKF